MILLDLFFFVIFLFFALPLVLALLLWFKIRFSLMNPFLRQADEHRAAQDDNVIEGEYKVLDDPDKE